MYIASICQYIDYYPLKQKVAISVSKCYNLLMIESRQSELFIPSIEAVRQLISNYIQARERSELPRSPAKTGFARYKDEDTGERATMTQYKPALLIIDHTLCIASLHTIEQTDGTITTELNLERHPFGEDGQEQGHPKYRLLPYQLYSLSLISH